MPIDFSPLQQIDPAGAFFQGRERAQAQAERNMLRQQQAEKLQFDRENMLMQRQRQQLEFEQAQQDRRRQLQQEEQFGRMADLIRQNGLDPDDPKVLSQFAEAAMVSRQPQLASFVTSMADRAAKRRAATAEARQIGEILGPPRLPPGPPLQPGAPQNALAGQAPMVNALAAPQPDLLAGTPFSIGPVAAPMPAPAPAPAVAPAAAPDNAAKTAQLESQRDALEALGTPAALAQAKRIDRQLEKLQPKAPPLPASEIQQYNLAVQQGFQGTIFDFKRQLAAASRAPREPKGPGSPVAVVDPETQRTIFVTPEEALQRRMTPASATEGLAPKEIQKREASYPKTTAALRSFETQADTLVANLTKLRDHPGLSGITGFVFGRTPAITAEARSAKADLDNILARGGFAELAAMRQASPTGGALGNISNQEVQYLRQAFGALDPVQDTETFKQKINDVIAQLQTSKRNVREEYDNTYEYRAQRAAAAGGAPAPGGFPKPPQAAIDQLKSGKGTDAQFDEIFGPGAAARARRQ